ncbi:MAG: HEAT repeat domain-containing protein [Chloroflexales bacterium]|nr:HEAT repeat domain-containing protein [Chloroflexales bacterium]
MPASSVFQFLRGGGALRRHRNVLRTRIQQEPAIQLLPKLLDLPLIPYDLSDRGILTMFAQYRYLTFRGETGSGRSLALLQTAWHWAINVDADPVLLLSLVQADIPNLPPQAILTDALHAIGLQATFENTARSSKRRPWTLLLDDWELLETTRREVWRDFVLTLLQLCPEVRVALALPKDSAEWPGFQSIDLLAPDDAQLKIWLAHFLPDCDPAPICGALESPSPLAPLRNRLLDLALIGLTYPSNGMPSSRLQLYESVMQLVNTITPQSMNGSAVAEPPVYVIGQSMLRSFTLAHELASTGNVAGLANLDQYDRAQVAPILAEMLPDPTALYTALWGPANPTRDDLFTLGRCVQVRQAVDSDWSLRVLMALGDQPDGSPHRMLLDELVPLIPGLIATAHFEAPSEQIHDVLTKLAPMLRSSILSTLIDTPAADPERRWVAADVLAQLSDDAARQELNIIAPPDELSQAARGYLFALGDSEARRALATPERLGWVAALRNQHTSQLRRTRVSATLLEDPDTPVDLRTTALNLIDSTDTETSLKLLAQACVDKISSVRQTALTALRQHEPRQALQVLAHVLLEANVSWAAQRHVLEHLARYPQPEAGTLLARCALAATLPLAGRLRALNLLSARRKTGPILLQRLLTVNTAHPAVRAMVVRLLGRLRQIDALAAVRQIALSSEPFFVRREAIAALGLLGQDPTGRATALAGLVALLKQHANNPDLIICTMHALGTIRAFESVPLLHDLLHLTDPETMESRWLEVAPHLAHTPADQWITSDMADETRVALLTALNRGDTPVDQPSSLNELVQMDVRRVRMAAAEALAQIGVGAAPSVQRTVRTTLLSAVRIVSAGPEVRHWLVCLSRVSNDHDLSDFAKLLGDPAIDVNVHWLLIEHLGAKPAALPLLLELLEQGALEPFIQGKLVQMLGCQRSPRVLPVLRQLAEQNDTNPHVRSHAIVALGLLSDPAVETTLLHVLMDVQVPVTVRSAAAVAMPAPLSADVCRQLRDLLQRERHSTEVMAGLLGALGRTQDREALPLMLRYTQHEHPVVAQAALDAIAASGDANIAPALVSVAQNTMLEQSVRLHAVGVLLTLSGAEYLPLLRSYLDIDISSLQLQALDYLLMVQPNDPHPLKLITDKSAPLVVRLRAVEAIADQMKDHPALYSLVLETSDSLQLRERIATLLGQTEHKEAMRILIQCIQANNVEPRIRQRCMESLAAQAQSLHSDTSVAQLTLSRIADDPRQPPENRSWALWGLGIEGLHALQGDYAG